MFGRRDKSSDPDSPPETVQSAPPHGVPAPVRSGPPPAGHKRLGEVLVEEGAISQAQLDEALAIQAREGGFLGQILVNQRFTTQEAVASCLVKQCKIPHLSLLDYDISKEVISLLPRDTCRHYNLLPIDKLGRILTVAMVDPLDLDALQAVRDACPDLRIKPILCNWEHFDHVMRRVFQDESGPSDAPTQVSFSSLGLSENIAPSKKVAAGSPAAAPPEDDIDEAALKSAVDSLIQEAAAQADADLPSAVEVTAPERGDSSSPESVKHLVREGLRDATAELVRLVQAQQASASAAGGISREELAGTLREALRETLAARPAAPADSELSGPAIAEIIRESIGGAMREVVASLPAQAPQAPAASGGQPPGTAGDIAAQLSSALREGMREAQAAQEARLAQLAEATMQSVQQISQFFEQTQVQQGNLRDLQGRRKHHDSVTPFGTGGAETGAANADSQLIEAMESEKPVEEFTYESFFPGSTNAFTHKLSQAVAENPGSEYNPLFVYGEVGVGKTHLISATGNAILRNNPKARVGYVSASHFARRLAEAARDDALESFRENYCHWDVLILDDIQFLGGRVEAQEEFFHIFNVLQQQGRQVIIASDKPPDRLGLLEKRLVSRFASGIVAQLKAPEMETRLRILRHAVQQSGAAVPDDVLALIAMRVSHDVRKMTGCLRKVIAFARLVGQEMNCELADEILSHLGAEEAA